MGGTKTEYFLNGTQILAQKTGSNTPMVFYYDHNGKRVAFKNTDGAVYFYVYNLQGDVVQLLDSSRNVVGEYVYGPYGYLENSSSLTTVAKANPFRYRGYYYDTENGYSYLIDSSKQSLWHVGGLRHKKNRVVSNTSLFFCCIIFHWEIPLAMPQRKGVPAAKKADDSLVLCLLCPTYYSSLNIKLLMPPLLRYRCSVVSSFSFFRSFIARLTVDCESFRSRAIVGIAGQHSPVLFARSKR